MNVLPGSDDEARRVSALQALEVLDSAAEPVFDSLVAAASQLCAVPIALISLIDAERQWFKANLGLPGVTHTPRDAAFCAHTIRGDAVFEVGDARQDSRFTGNPLVTGEPKIRFYAGAPIVLAGGERIGSLCVIDREPRQLDAAQRAALQSLARVAGHCLVERQQRLAAARELAASEQRYRAIVEDQSELISVASLDGTLSFVNAAYARHHGQSPEQLVGRQLMDYVPASDRESVALHLAAVQRSLEPLTGLNRITSAAGQERWVAWSNRCLRDARGRPMALQSVGRDITEQHLAEQALWQSRQRLARLYEATPAMLHSIDRNGRLVAVSDIWLQVLGYERSQVIGRLSSEFLAPESQRRAREQVLPEFFRTGHCERIDYQMLRRDGSIVDIELSAVLERDESGAPLQSLAVLENVSARKQLALELGRTHAHLDAIVDNVPAMLGYWDAGGITRFANREFQASVGLPMQQIVGKSLRELWQEVDAQGYAEVDRHVQAVLGGQRQEFESAMLTTVGLRQLRATFVPDRSGRADGSDGSGTAVRSDSQDAIRVGGFYGLWVDITGRKTLELRLRDSELRYRSLFDHLNSGFALCEMVVDGEGRPVDYRYLAMNPAFSAVTGIDAARAIGRRVTEVLPGTAADPADRIGVFGRVAQSGEPAHFEQRSVELGRWFDVVAYRPAPGQFALIVQDTTPRKLAEQRIELALAEKETLLKEVYHRVKNNLQVVQSLLALQQRSVTDPAARAALDNSVQRVRAMALVHEKLYQSGDLAVVTLADYTRDLLRQIGEGAGARERGIRLVAEVGPWQTGLDNAIPFGLLVAELVGNGLKHGFVARPGGGEIRVSLVREGGGARLRVADDGVGLPSHFDLSAHASMGLQLAASLARQLGGELEARQREGGAGDAGGAGAAFSALLTRL